MEGSALVMDYGDVSAPLSAADETTNMSADGDDSDDLQFVDDLNLDSETLDQSTPAAIPRIPSPVLGLDSGLLEQNTNPLEQSNHLPKSPTLDQIAAETLAVKPSLLSPGASEAMDTALDTSLGCEKGANKDSGPAPVTPLTANVTKRLRLKFNGSVDIIDLDKGGESSQSPVASTPPAVSNLIKHVVDGFTVEESSLPFPVHRSSLLTELQQRTKRKVTRRRMPPGISRSQPSSQPSTPVPTTGNPAEYFTADSSVVRANITADLASRSMTALVTPSASRTSMGTPVSHSRISQNGECEACTMCQSPCVDLCFYRNSPYCSRRCIKRTRCELFSGPDAPTQKRGRPRGAMTRNKPTFKNSGKVAKVIFRRYRPKSSLSDTTDTSNGTQIVKDEPQIYSSMPGTGRFPSENGYESEDSLLNGSELLGDGYKRADVLHWTISDVRDFIQSLQGCENYGKIFEDQEIDGRALVLLHQDHLLNALSIKLGPAIKIHNEICLFSIR